ncbi:MAG: sugar transferase, partial [Candidatus Binatia bacterium]
MIRLLPGWGLGAVEELRRTVLLLVGVFAATTTALFLLKRSEEISRMTVSLAFLASLPLLPYARIKSKTLLIRLRLWGMRCVVFGDERSARSILETLRDEPGLGYVPVAIHDPSGRTVVPAIDGIPLTADPDPRRWRAHVSILMVEPMSKGVGELLDGPLATFRHVVVIPDLAEAPSLWVTPRSLGGILGLEISQNLNDPSARIVKRASDLLLVTATVPFWFPIMVAISLLILAAERKTPFFVHRRLGLRGKEFLMWKFRTMRPEAEKALGEKLGVDEVARSQWRTNFKLADDPRVTEIGRFLRQTSLDELPQLLNVLRGDMSIVGPRPLPAYHARELPDR